MQDGALAGMLGIELTSETIQVATKRSTDADRHFREKRFGFGERR
jgi:hypothetical protein